MIMLFVAAILFIVSGIGMIAFPNMTRSLDRFDNSMRGRQSQEGGAYTAGRIIRGVLLVLAGVGILLLPLIFL